MVRKSLEKNLEKTDEPDHQYLRVKIYGRKEILTHFYGVFQNGVQFRCKVGRSIEDLLMGQMGLNPKFVEEKINTIFLNGRCVDDLSSAVLVEGSVVAFSSALPGLAGATLRRGGAYAVLRDSITHTKNERFISQREGYITVKCFNLLMPELGRIFLEKGIFIDRAAGADLFKKEEGFWRLVDAIEAGGKPLSQDRISGEINSGSCDRIMISAVINRPRKN
jgi:hypothetical protein